MNNHYLMANSVAEFLQKHPNRANSSFPTPLEITEAIDLFNALSNFEDMGWGFVRTSCYPKAYLLCEVALAKRLIPQKAWAFEGESPLTGVHPSGGEFNWWYHVALALPVTMADGRVENLVFDPTLFDAPVSLVEWGETMGAQSNRLAVVPYDQTPDASLLGDLKVVATHSPQMTQKALDKIQDWGLMIGAGPRKVFKSHTLGEYISSEEKSEYGKPLRRNLPRTDKSLRLEIAK